jgi:UDP-2,3-diacylglucosamine pyrophosphatase LpxH
LRKRKLEIAVISDVHLGTYGCYANELLAYLSSISPKTLILNGDIVDIWHFKKSYFPPSHLNVIKKIISMASEGTAVYYITGNHDEVPALLERTAFGNINFCKKLVLNLDGKKTWFFHGAILDIPLVDAKWIAKLGTIGFDLLLRVNSLMNWTLKMRKQEKYSLSGKIKGSKARSKYSSDFERTVTDLAADNGYDCVVCGHIHEPKKEQRETSQDTILYLNSGDWVENRTALEYSFKRWKLYQNEKDKLRPFFEETTLNQMDINELVASINSKKLVPLKEV